MEIHTKWQVVGLDAADMNAVTDGPNPDGPNFADVAGNSMEQQVALKTWVDAAIDMLNRAEPEDAILAKLAHDGCPDPQNVLKMALEQPAETPIDDEAGLAPATGLPPQDANDTAGWAPQGVQASSEKTCDTCSSTDEVRAIMTDDGAKNFCKSCEHPDEEKTSTVRKIMESDPMQSRTASAISNFGPSGLPTVGMPDPVAQDIDGLGTLGVDQLKVKLAEAEAAGDEPTAQKLRQLITDHLNAGQGRMASVGGVQVKLLGVFVNEFDQIVARVSADGNEVDVDPDTVEVIPEDATDHATEVQNFIDSFPEVEANDLNSVRARETNLKTTRDWVREIMAIETLPEVQRERVAKIGLQVEGALTAAISRVASLQSPEDAQYLDGLPNFEVAAQMTSQVSHGTDGGIDLDTIARTMEGKAIEADYQKEISEGSQILVSEVDPDVLHDEVAVGGAAARHINAKTGGLPEKTRGEIRDLFLAAVDLHRTQRLAHIRKSDAEAQERVEASIRVASTSGGEALTSDDGPAEMLFW